MKNYSQNLELKRWNSLIKEIKNLSTYAETINLVMAQQSSVWTSPLVKLVLETTSKSLPENVSNV